MLFGSSLAAVPGCLLLSVLLACAGSCWINALYRRPGAPLSFPEETVRRARWRCPLLAASVFGCAWHILPLPFPVFGYLLAGIFLLLLTVATDLEQQVIFDRMLLPLAAIGIAASFHLGLPLADRALAAIAGGLAFLLLAVLTRGAIGGGDIKLIAVLGLWLGTDGLLNVVTAGIILGGIAACIMLVTKQKGRHSTFAYGPYFALTAIAALMLCPPCA